MAVSLFEHINLNVTDRDTAIGFYVEGLGCGINPNNHFNMAIHVNLGPCQFHLPWVKSMQDSDPIEQAQVLNGWIELWTKEPTDELYARLVKIRATRSINIQIEKVQQAFDNNPGLVVVGPYGNTFRIAQASPELAEKLLQLDIHPGGSNLMLGIRRTVINVPVGSSGKIQDFYYQVLGCTVVLGDTKCTVKVDNIVPGGQEVVFQECEKVTDPRPYDTDFAAQYHIAIYLDSNESFLKAFQNAQKRGEVYVNPRFIGGPIEFSSAATLEEAEKSWQFRLRDISNVFQLEHEVRSPSHVCFHQMATKL